MYKKVMVPLDGSELAECVLPHVEAFIKGFPKIDMAFVRVVQPVSMAYDVEYIKREGFKEEEENMKSAAKNYLDQVINGLEQGESKLHSEVMYGRVPDSLTDYVLSNDIDLILIATHGRSGIGRWVRGSVADKILRSANVPVMMVRAPGTKGGI